jgi:hypothetical protein
MTRPTTLLGVSLSSLLLVTTLAACPGSDDGGGGSCGDYTDALVGYLDRCSGGEGAPLETARARFTGVCNRAIAAPGASNLAAQLASCTQTFATTACGQDIECGNQAGTLENGAPCGQGYQCKSGACGKASGAACGTCSDRVAIGGDCSGGKRCVDNATCVIRGSDTAPTTVCEAVTIAKVGESCASMGSAGRVRCAANLACASGPTGDVCRERGPAGTACSSRSECAEGLICQGETCAASLTEGAACTANDCARGLECDETSKKCVRIVFVTGGQECDYVRRCARGECQGRERTTAGATVTVKPGKCVDPIPDGSPCTPGEDAPPCDVFAKCVNGFCSVEDPSQCK